MKPTAQRGQYETCVCFCARTEPPRSAARVCARVVRFFVLNPTLDGIVRTLHDRVSNDSERMTATSSPSQWTPGDRGREIVLEQGTVLAGKYRLETPAGFGGMAQLWVATNTATGAEV